MQRSGARFAAWFGACLAALGAPLLAQPLPAAVSGEQPVTAAQPAQDAIIFMPGTGVPHAAPLAPVQRRMACTALPEARARLAAQYPAATAIGASVPAETGPDALAAIPPGRHLDRALLDEALASYERHLCAMPGALGPAEIVVVDFARHSTDPRLYIVDLEKGTGLDRPILVAHGIGSDPDDDGYATAFGNAQESWMSSLGAARGAELYRGRNGLSLRLDGLDPSNSAMRPRDIVVHSYAPERRRYFNYSHVATRGGKPGTSEGCFVVEPQYRDVLYDRLRDGGFLYAGLGKESAAWRQRFLPVRPITPWQGEVIFAPGTGN